MQVHPGQIGLYTVIIAIAGEMQPEQQQSRLTLSVHLTHCMLCDSSAWLCAITSINDPTCCQLRAVNMECVPILQYCLGDAGFGWLCSSCVHCCLRCQGTCMTSSLLQRTVATEICAGTACTDDTTDKGTNNRHRMGNTFELPACCRCQPDVRGPAVVQGTV